MTAINPQAVRGPVTAVPVVAGKGVRFVEDVTNNRVVAEADETVLSDTATLASDSAEIALSEAYTNFERIRIECIRNPSVGNASYCNEFAVDSTHNKFRCVSFLPQGSSATNWYIAITECSLTGNKLTVLRSFRYLFPGATVDTGAPDTITKIVGINRIASA